MSSVSETDTDSGTTQKSLSVTFDELNQEAGKLSKKLSKSFNEVRYLVGIATGIAGVIIAAKELHIFKRIQDISQWPTLQNGGTVLGSYLENKSNSDTLNILVASKTQSYEFYRTRASFYYSIDKSVGFISRNISYYEPWSSNPMFAQNVHEILTEGTVVDIKFNPKNNSEAYIYNFRYDTFLYLFIGIVLILIGLFVVFCIKS